MSGGQTHFCARRAGVSHAAPAYHFGSLDGLLQEVAADGYERLMRYIDESHAEEGSLMMACGLGYVRYWPWDMNMRMRHCLHPS